MVLFHLDLSAQRAGERARECRQALEKTPEASERRAALLAVLAVAQSFTTPEQAERTVTQAEQVADLIGSPGARVYTLLARFAMDLSPQSLERRSALAGEALALLDTPECAGLRPHLLPVAYFVHLGVLMESGNIRALDEALSPELHLTDQLAEVLHSRYAVWFRCARASMDGQLKLAERLADEGHGLAIAAGDVDAEYVWAGQIAIIRWMQGRVSEMEPLFLHARQADPAEPVWAAAVAWIWSHQGRAEAARGLIESLPDVDVFVRGRNWLAAVAILAELAAEVGSPELVERLRQALAPFADRVVPIGLGVTCWGTVARPLALLARRQGRPDEARRQYLAAVDLCSRIGAQAWLAQAQVELAALTAEQGEVGSARRLATESVAAARHLGLRAVEQRADRLLGRIDADATEASAPPPAVSTPGWPARIRAIPAHASPADPAVTGRTQQLPPKAEESEYVPQRHDLPRITVLGGFSVTSGDGVVAAWKSRKARTLLKMLLARRGAALARESAMELLWPGQDPRLLRNRFAVATTAVRKALDPHRRQPSDGFLVANEQVLRLRVERLSVDVEDFLMLAERARTAPAAASGPDSREQLLRRAAAGYTGDAFADEPYAAWAEQVRRQAHLAFFSVSHALAEVVAGQDDQLGRVQLYRGILAKDPFDLHAHDGLVDALSELGAAAHIAAAQQERQRRIAELGIGVPPSPSTSGIPSGG